MGQQHKKPDFLYPLLIIWLTVTTSCTSQIKKEATLYCNCLKETYGKNGDLRNLARCYDIQDSLASKYEDNEAYLNELNERMLKCSEEAKKMTDK